jgi:flagellar hook-associated protein 1
MSGILSNAISGLQASQTALRTAGHNISNANTVGYSRQQVEYATRPEQRAGTAGFIGSGVTVTNIERVVNEFVTTQLRLDTAAFNQLNTYNSNIGKIDKLFSDINTGLAGGMQSYFSALQNAADDPSSVPARQLLVTETDSLTVRFNNLYDRLTEVEKGVQSEIKTNIEQVVTVAKTIANLNDSIGKKNASSSGGAPNDLLDQRDEALRKLSELISVQLVKDTNGNINAFIGNGEPLVVGPQVSSFEVTNDGKILISNGKNSFDITSQVQGGKLGGLVDFRESVLRPSMNNLGRLAIVFADQFNTQQAQGLDLDGEYGTPIFADYNQDNLAYDRVIHGDNNPPFDRLLSVTIEDTQLLTASDYEFSIAPNSNNFTVTRKSDGKMVEQGMLSGAYPRDISFDGITLHLQSGSFQGGDSFTLSPTRMGARDISSLINRAEDFAFAVPVRALAVTENSGNGVISPGRVLSVEDMDGNSLPIFSVPGKLSPPLVVRFTSETTYEILDNTDPAHPVDLIPPIREQTFVPGVNNELFSVDKGETRVVGQGQRLGLPAGRTSIATDNSVSGFVQTNGYPAEQFMFSLRDSATGSITTKNIITQSGNSAAQTAALMNTVKGVSANAFTSAAITDIQIDPAGFTYPLQITLNGENLIEHVGTALAIEVPDPNVNEVAFNNYLAERINSNGNLQSLGIRATSGHNAITGAPEVRIVASSGVDLEFRLQAYSSVPASLPVQPINNFISINDGQGNPNVRLTGIDDPASALEEQDAIVVGGRIDVTLAAGVSFSTVPSTSQLFGDSTSADFARSSYIGLQASITGKPKAGDRFLIDFNSDASNDNRNALEMVALENKKTLDGSTNSFGQDYGRLVEEIGTKSSLAKINTEASKSLLEQTQALRDGYAGVNLDEEAADLIRFEQMYTANARVISVARELFDTLLQSL